ncbi:GNAT family N-acetyltransferase [Micromonospora sp. NPDC000207]|uniref:GNAT family N-acetyltransferase n=1 Tax=Micromonospora sp. NPDC000207 TaxID=3154246 RepID=UPI0033321A0E
MAITISPFDADDPAAIEAAYRIGAAAERVDVPDLPPLCWQSFEGTVRHPMPGRRQLWALARLDGEPAGYLSVELHELDNLDLATSELVVDPAYRRRGVGRALHGHALGLARENGRKQLIFGVVSALPGGETRPEPGTAFATAMGATPALLEVRRRLDLHRLDSAGLDAAAAEAQAHAAGYELVRWGGQTPPEHLADIVYLDGRILIDVPLGDLGWEPEKVDADRVRGTERALALRGHRRYQQGVRHVASGRVVAWTVLEFSASPPWHAYQQITIVDPEHRGRRLGLLAKIANLRYVLTREPGLRYVDTWNAEVNTHMIAVNERMGFRAVDAWTEWQQTL